MKKLKSSLTRSKSRPTRLKPKLKKFVPLDLGQCNTVGQIIEAMSKTPVGSGMLGRFCMDIGHLIASGVKPLVVFDSSQSSSLVSLFGEMRKHGWISGLVTPENYAKRIPAGKTILVVGRFSERYEEVFYKKPDRAFFVNQWGLASRDHIQDGYFQDIVVADPCFVIPLLFSALQEWLENKPWPVDERFISWIEKFGGAGEEFGHGARVIRTMASDPECTVVFTATGVVTVAQMSPIICDLIDNGKIHLVVTTGALLGHGLVWSLDLNHYRHDPSLNDKILAKYKLNRITDAIEPETNLDHVEEIIDKVLNVLPENIIVSSYEINRLIGNFLKDSFPDQRGILKSAAEKNVPVIIPAFYDSELGNDLITHNRRRKQNGKKPIYVNLEKDSDLLIDVLTKAKKRGIFTLGGGPPRNTPQNVPPLVEILNDRLNLKIPVPMYQYGCRVCPDPIWLGHLGGCTYAEGMSWRKMDPRGQFAELRMDAMHVFPFLAKFILE